MVLGTNNTGGTITPASTQTGVANNVPSPAAIQTALQGLQTVGAGNAIVTGGATTTNYVLSVLDTTTTTGTYTLTYNGQSTTALSYTSSALVVQNALAGLSSIGSTSNVSVVAGSGGIGNTLGGEYIITIAVPGNFTATGASGATTTVSTYATNPTYTISFANSGVFSAASSTITATASQSNYLPGLTLDDTGTNVNSRLPVATVLNLDGGNLYVKGSGSTATNETIGAVALSSGGSTIQLDQNGTGSTTLSAVSMTRAPALQSCSRRAVRAAPISAPRRTSCSLLRRSR